MGNAFRRSVGKVQSSSSSGIESSSKLKNTTHLRQPPPPAAVPVEKAEILTKQDNVDQSSSEATPQVKVENLLEERDPHYDVLLSQMGGRIKTKAGGKQEMGEAHVVEKYNRPMPKLRNTKPDSSSNEERPVTLGTLNVKQLRQIILLHQGKADDHNGPMDTQQIAEKFRIDAVQVQSILQSVSLPQESSTQEYNR